MQRLLLTGRLRKNVDIANNGREAHDLKSNAATLGFVDLSELCKELEMEAMGLKEAGLASRLARMDDLVSLARRQCQEYMGA